MCKCAIKLTVKSFLKKPKPNGNYKLWRSKLDLILECPFEMIFVVFVEKIMLNGYIIEIFKWGLILMEVMGFSF
jgi:hypothetical protein